MSECLDSWRDAWRPQDLRTVADWATQHVQFPNSARSKTFSIKPTPHLAEPLACFNDSSIREQVIIMPTGAGKTTIFDACIPYAIAEAPGDILLGMQTDPDAKEHMESRLGPTLAECEPISAVMQSVDRHARRKDAIILPHMSIYCRGSNKTNFQRISVRYVFLDEVWLIKHGLVDEARARTHSRWNRKIVLVSQGGEMHVTLQNEKRDTELHAAWLRTDQREFSMVCPECSEVSAWSHKHLRYLVAETPNEQLDEAGIIQSTTYECPECKTNFEDRPTLRRQLSESSIYVPTNPTPFIDARGGRYVGHHASALSMLHESWGDLAVMRERARRALKQGDIEPMRTLVTKRWAMFWKGEEETPNVVLGASGLTKADFAEGQVWPGEVYRALTIDRQRDHFYAVARAWKVDGSSCLLWEGKLSTVEMCRELQTRLKVLDDYTFQDAQHATGDVYDDCARYGWVALHGSGDDGFLHLTKNKKAIKKFFSPLRWAQAPGGSRARYIFWSNEKVKDILVQKRAGRGLPWLTLDDVSDGYRAEMASEIKRDVINKVTKAVSQRYVKIRKDNHRWDCEAMQITFALIKGVIGTVETHMDGVESGEVEVPAE